MISIRRSSFLLLVSVGCWAGTSAFVVVTPSNGIISSSLYVAAPIEKHVGTGTVEANNDHDNDSDNDKSKVTPVQQEHAVPEIHAANVVAASVSVPQEEEEVNDTTNKIVVDEETTMDDILFAEFDKMLIDWKDNKEVAHLQKKLRYWKQEQKKQEQAFANYVLKQNIEQKLRPIYKREGKIDMYMSRPVFDKETERIQTEIWAIKERIKLTHAKLQEEYRVEQVKKETAARLSRYDSDIQNLKNQLVKASKRLQIKDLFRSTAKTLKNELAQAKKEQKRIRQESEARLRGLQTDYKMSMEGLQKQSSERLSQKEQEIHSLANEIETLIATLQQKKKELNVKEEVVLTLDTELQEKESTLRALMSERASLRALARQSWKVFKSRVHSRLQWPWAGKGANKITEAAAAVAVADVEVESVNNQVMEEVVQENPVDKTLVGAATTAAVQASS